VIHTAGRRRPGPASTRRAYLRDLSRLMASNGHLDFCSAHLHSADLEEYSEGSRRMLSMMRMRGPQAPARGGFTPDAGDAVQKLGALLLVHERDKPVAISRDSGSRGTTGEISAERPSPCPPPPCSSSSRPPRSAGGSGTIPAPRSARPSQQHIPGKSRQESQKDKEYRGDQVGPGLGGELFRDVLAKGRVGDGPGDDDAVAVEIRSGAAG